MQQIPWVVLVRHNFEELIVVEPVFVFYWYSMLIRSMNHEYSDEYDCHLVS